MRQKKKVLILIQARMGSTRLPKKVLADVEGRPMLLRLYDRMRKVKSADEVAIATTDNPNDDIIAETAQKNGIPLYRGSENDIIDRLYQAAKKFGGDVVVRITADCPLADPRLIDRMVGIFLEKGYDFFSNVNPPTYPDGLDVEMVSFDALERMWKGTSGNAFLREWFRTYIVENPDKFSIGNLANGRDISWMRWTVDEKEDLKFVRKVFAHMLSKGKDVFYMEDVLRLLEGQPGLMEINRKFVRDERYAQALEERKKGKEVKGMHHPFIVGEKIYLRGMERKDLEGPLFQWANDSEVTHYMFMGLKPNSMELLCEEYERMMRSNNDVVFLIVDKKTDKPIGSAGLYVINWVSRSAEYRIVIGEKEYWGKGYGTETAKLLVRYGFDKLNLNRIWLGVNADNPAGIKSYEKAGFVREGVLRQEIYRNSRYYDAIRMSMLRSEYEAKHRQG